MSDEDTLLKAWKKNDPPLPPLVVDTLLTKGRRGALNEQARHLVKTYLRRARSARHA